MDSKPVDSKPVQRSWTETRLALVLIVLGASFARADAEPPLSFVNDVVPVLTKAGCNAGSCHAKAGNGQNGFQLSVLGFDPQDDYARLVKEGRGRRVFPAAPEKSLLLVKASGQVPHGGGVRLPADSPGYATLLQWIRQGMPWGRADEPTLVALRVEPTGGRAPKNSEQQLRAVAVYSDGSERDVTPLALYEPNDAALALVSSQGLVQIQDIPGRVAVMVRFQGRVSVFTAAVPLGAPVEQLPAPKNLVDQFVFENLKQLGIPPSELCDDATFLRRVTLDVAGRLPTADEAADFLANTAADKRDQAIDRLLRSPQYADYFAAKWTPLLKNRRDDATDITANFAFHAWLRDSLLANVPYDQLVRELLAATGTVVGNPPVAWYKRVKDPKEQLEDVAQLFLGVRMQCAQCHHHPFERWSQDDYYGLAAFFNQIGRKPTATAGEDLIFHRRGVALAQNVRTGAVLKPTALGDDVGEVSPDDDPRLALADWMRQPNNPFFAKALVNRYWKHFFKRGLIEPEDDIRDTNPPTNPELMAALERWFIDSSFNLKELVRLIAQSRTYQLSAVPNAHNLVDRQNFSRFYPRRLTAEVLLDSIDDVTGAATTFANLPAGTRAIALPDNSYNQSSPFLQVFGRPASASVCECERVQSSSLAQSLHLLNSGEIKGKLAAGDGRAARFAAATAPPEASITELYRAAFARDPRLDELQAALAYLREPMLDAAGQPLPAAPITAERWQDLIWAVMNTKEFLFNH